MEKQNLNINAAALPTLSCPQCGGFTFGASFIVKKLSALISPNGKETIVPIQVFTCNFCHSILPIGDSKLDDLTKDIRTSNSQSIN